MDYAPVMSGIFNFLNFPEKLSQLKHRTKSNRRLLNIKWRQPTISVQMKKIKLLNKNNKLQIVEFLQFSGVNRFFFSSSSRLREN